jgi:hypothetical protein
MDFHEKKEEKKVQQGQGYNASPDTRAQPY